MTLHARYIASFLAAALLAVAAVSSHAEPAKMTTRMKGRKLRGDFEKNCFVLSESSQAQECLIIDPGFSPDIIVLVDAF